MNEQANIIEDEKKTLAKEAREAKKFSNAIEKQKAGIVKKRGTKAKKIKMPLLKKYDMLRERRNGKAVVPVISGVCQGCFMNIPPQQFNDILRGDKMFNCPTCQRILYHQPEKTEE